VSGMQVDSMAVVSYVGYRTFTMWDVFDLLFFESKSFFFVMVPPCPALVILYKSMYMILRLLYCS